MGMEPRRLPPSAAAVVAVLLLAAVAAPGGVAPAGAVAPADPAPYRADAGGRISAAVLEDPDGRPWRLSELDGQPVVVVVADRAASGEAVDWGRRIGAAWGERISLWSDRERVAVLSVADLRAVPGFARGIARWIIARLVADEADPAGRASPPLLLDWDGVVIGALDVEPEGATVIVLGRDRGVEFVATGEPTEEKVARLGTALERVDARPATPALAAGGRP